VGRDGRRQSISRKPRAATYAASPTTPSPTRNPSWSSSSPWSVPTASIGAGGGSTARVDALGLLNVGPDSAGADPGPACYGASGTAATVTDADLLLGYLNPEYFLGGKMPLHTERASSAITQSVAKPLGIDVTQAARGIYEVVNDNMANAASVYAAEQGVDLRDFTLLAFGGAAPAHVCDVAHRLRIRDVRIPVGAGV